MEIFQFGDLRVSLITLLLDFESTDSRQKGLNRTSNVNSINAVDGIDKKLKLDSNWGGGSGYCMGNGKDFFIHKTRSTRWIIRHEVTHVQ